MTAPLIAPGYAAVMAAFFIVLSVLVIRARGRHKVALGSGGVPALERLVRAHGNFAEYVSFTLLLLLMAELRGAPPLALHALALCLLAGRLIHAWGLSRPAESLRPRIAGMALTFTALGGSALLIPFA